MLSFWQAAADLVLGAACPACGRPGHGTCRRCATLVPARPVEIDVGGLRAVAGRPYDEATRAVLLAWKVGGRSGHDALMAHLLASAVADLLGDHSRVVLVPVPATRRSRRERGRDLVRVTANRAARMLRGVGIEADVLPAVRLCRQPADQHDLGPQARRANLRDSMRASPRGLRGRSLVVVDDVLTTGATVAEAARALRRSGLGEVLGAATIAASLGIGRSVASHPGDGLRSR